MSMFYLVRKVLRSVFYVLFGIISQSEDRAVAAEGRLDSRPVEEEGDSLTVTMCR